MLGIIGGTGLAEPNQFGWGELERQQRVETPFGNDHNDKVTVEYWRVDSKELLFLPRHGFKHSTPPHRINYRANIWALKNLGVTKIIAVNAVGGITSTLKPGSFVVPDQLIDYTSDREMTFFDGLTSSVSHIDFSKPYTESLRALIIKAAGDVASRNSSEESIVDHGCYACTQGPRLETAAEIKRLAADGCNIVGMTGMPEASLAREVELEYACLAFVVNLAAGVGSLPIKLAEVFDKADSCRAFIAETLEVCISKLHF